MDIYYKMAKYPIFTIEKVNEYYKNIGSARSAVKRLLQYGHALKIRNNLYTCVSAEQGGPIADRFQIASAINKTSYVSHHTAMEYYGITNQVFYDVYVSSKIRFHNFEFDGYVYHFVQSNLDEGIDSLKYSGGIKITDKERTLIDCLKDLDKISGLEEVVENISSMQHIEETKLLHYLSLYSNQFLYQKVGLILFDFRERLGLSDTFFEICQSYIGKSKRYLTRNIAKGRYDKHWKLVVPDNLMTSKNGEAITDATI
jgi:predicted transcriptional regulator of viral defense system